MRQWFTLTEAATPENLKKEAMKTDSQCSALAGQHPCPHMVAVTECGFESLPHSPYSPDMDPSDFYLFQMFKSHLCGAQYGSMKAS